MQFFFFFQIWNLRDGSEVAVCSKHDGWVTSCWFSPDTHMLVSVSDSVQVTESISWRCHCFIIFVRLVTKAGNQQGRVGGEWIVVWRNDRNSDKMKWSYFSVLDTHTHTLGKLGEHSSSWETSLLCVVDSLRYSHVLPTSHVFRSGLYIERKSILYLFYKNKTIINT